MSDQILGRDEDGGRMTSKALAAWLGQHRDNDVKVVFHGMHVPIGAAYYCPHSDALVLHPMPGEDLRIATSFCERPSEAERSYNPHEQPGNVAENPADETSPHPAEEPGNQPGS